MYTDHDRAVHAAISRDRLTSNPDNGPSDECGADTIQIITWPHSRLTTLAYVTHPEEYSGDVTFKQAQYGLVGII